MVNSIRRAGRPHVEVDASKSALVRTARAGAHRWRRTAD